MRASKMFYYYINLESLCFSVKIIRVYGTTIIESGELHAYSSFAERSIP